MSSFLELFSNQSLAQVLCHFFLNPYEAFSQARIVRETGKALIQVQRALKRLKKIGLIFANQKNHKTYYKADPSHPAFEDLKKAFLKTCGIGDLLRQSAHAQGERIDFAWIFGSVARGEENRESDIDIILVSDLTLEQISHVIAPLSRSIKRELNMVFLTPSDLYRKYHSEDYFVRELVKQPKIWLVGDDHELARLLERTEPEIAIGLEKRNRTTIRPRRARSRRRSISRNFSRSKIHNGL